MGNERAAAPPGHGALSDKRSRTVGSILSAAMLIVTEEGIAALSMSALAARAGVSRQTLYNYFPDVDAVLASMVELGDAGTAELAGRMREAADARDALAVFVLGAVDTVRSGHPSPIAMSAALPPELRTAMRAHEARAEQVVVDALARGMAEGSLRADLEPELDGRILYRAAFAGAELARTPGADVDHLTERLRDDLLRMVTAGPDGMKHH